MKKLINLIVFIFNRRPERLGAGGYRSDSGSLCRKQYYFRAGIANRDRDSYPSVLGQMLGRGYEVRNFGFSARTMLMKGDHPYMKEQDVSGCLKVQSGHRRYQLGTNDSKSFNWKYKADLPKDMQTMVSAFKAIPSKPKSTCVIPQSLPGNNTVLTTVLSNMALSL